MDTDLTSTSREEHERLFKEAAPRLWRSLYVYTGRRDLAEDAVAEAFTRFLEQPDGIRNPLAWMYRTGFRYAKGELRRERRTSPQDIPAADPEELHDLLAALGRLPSNQRAAIVLHYRLGFSVREIAGILGIAPSTVKVHLHRGRKRLRSMLGDEEPRP